VGFDPESLLDNIRNIEKIPYLTKKILQEQGAQLLNTKYSRDMLHGRKTSGSTGITTTIYYSSEALDWTAASNQMALSWTGKKRHLREAYFSSLFPEAYPFKERVREQIKCMALNRTNITTHSFEEHNLATIIAKIKKIKPYYVQGHPSTMYAIALFLKHKNLFEKPLFNIFASTGEVLDRQKRETIEKYVGCRVYNRYGNAEFGVIAHEKGQSHKLNVVTSMVFQKYIFKVD